MIVRNIPFPVLLIIRMELLIIPDMIDIQDEFLWINE